MDFKKTGVEENIKVVGVMFVCMGNICRSPMAEAVFQWMVDQQSLSDKIKVASSAVGDWHIGERPHPGTQAVLKQNHIPLNPQKRALLLRPPHFQQYQYMLALDREVSDNIQHIFSRQVKRLLEYAPDTDTLDVPDPYYNHKFNLVYDLVTTGCIGLLEKIKEVEGL